MSIEITTELEVEAAVECGECGHDLDAKVVSRYGNHTIHVDPCPACLDAAREKAMGEATP